MFSRGRRIYAAYGTQGIGWLGNDLNGAEKYAHFDGGHLAQLHECDRIHVTLLR